MCVSVCQLLRKKFEKTSEKISRPSSSFFISGPNLGDANSPREQTFIASKIDLSAFCYLGPAWCEIESRAPRKRVEREQLPSFSHRSCGRKFSLGIAHVPKLFSHFRGCSNDFCTQMAKNARNKQSKQTQQIN